MGDVIEWLCFALIIQLWSRLPVVTICHITTTPGVKQLSSKYTSGIKNNGRSRAPSHGPQISQFHAVFRNILQSCILASLPSSPAEGLTSVSTQNFESVPEKCFSSKHVSPQIPPHQVKTPFNLNASSTNTFCGLNISRPEPYLADLFYGYWVTHTMIVIIWSIVIGYPLCHYDSWSLCLSTIA